MSNLARIFYIDKQIKKNGKTTLKEVADEFEMSTRQIRNDIEFMLYQLGAPIIYERKLKGYTYKTPFEYLCFTDEDFILSYAFIKKIIDNTNYVPIIKNEIVNSFKKFISKKIEKIADKIDYELSIIEKPDLKYFSLIIESFDKEKKFDLFYKRAKDNKEVKYSVEPLKLINYSGNWYLVGQIGNNANPTMFNMSRIVNIEISSFDYEKLIDSDTLKNFLNENFGIFKSSNNESESSEVTIRFYNSARFVVKNQIFHKDQQINEGYDSNKGDYIEIKVKVINYREILGEVLRYGDESEVIAPAVFRNQWEDKIKKMMRMI